MKLNKKNLLLGATTTSTITLATLYGITQNKQKEESKKDDINFEELLKTKTAENEQLLTQVKGLAGQNTILNDQLEVLKEEYRMTNDWVEMKEAEVTAYLKKIEKLTEELNVKTTTCKRINEEYHKALEKVSELIKEKDESMSSEGVWDTVFNTITGYFNSVDKPIPDTNEKTCKALADEIKSLKTDLEQADATRSQLLARIQQLEEEGTEGELESAVQGLTEENSRLNDELTKLEDEMKELRFLYQASSVQNHQTIKERDYYLDEYLKWMKSKQILGHYLGLDPQNFDPLRCRVGKSQSGQEESVSVACNGWYDVDGNINKDITVQLFIKKKDAPKDYETYLKVWNGNLSLR